MVRFWLVAWLVLGLYAPALLAHGDRQHDTAGEASVILEDLPAVAPAPVPVVAQAAEPTMDLSPLGLLEVKFDSLHPMFVHLPLVLFGVAPLALFFFLRTRQRAYGWVSFWSSAVGALGGLVAATLVHPEAQNLSAQASAVLERHEDWAYLSLSLGLVGIVAMALGLALQHKIWLYLALFAQLGALATVSLAGHLGAILTHVL